MEHAQRLAARVVRGVLAEGRSLNAALEVSAVARSPDRALVQELAYGTLRFLGQLRGVVQRLVDRPLSDADVEALLLVAAYQLVHTAAPSHAG